MWSISGKYILLFFSFWGKEKNNHISSSNKYLAFIVLCNVQIYLNNEMKEYCYGEAG